VTLVALPGWAQQQPAFVAACARRRLRAAQPPVLLVAQEQGRGIAQSVELLLRQERARRPDGLIITDDNLVPAATAGIAAAGGPKAGGVKVIAHTNFPWPTPSAVPVMRLGHSVRALLEKCVALIEQQRRGETPPAMTLVPAVFEEEL
jgi:DNA-binding LacI/PurR family transcriptional regulator